MVLHNFKCYIKYHMITYQHAINYREGGHLAHLLGRGHCLAWGGGGDLERSQAEPGRSPSGRAAWVNTGSPLLVDRLTGNNRV